MSKRIVQFTKLGNFGRFGNQLFQYVFARAYAEKYNAVLEIPYWIGEKIFKDVTHPLPSCKLPEMELNKVPWGKVNVDLFGYFNTKECFDILSETKIKKWLSFQDKWLELYSKEKYSVVAHIRRGDYSEKFSSVYCIVTESSYIRACEKYKIDKNRITWVSEESPTIDLQASEVCYKKIDYSMYRHGIYDDKGISFLPDFFKMINANILLRSNSTFSFWAGFFNKNKVYSPLVEEKVGLQDVDFIEGNQAKIKGNLPDFCFNL